MAYPMAQSARQNGILGAMPMLAAFSWYAAQGHFAEIWQATVQSIFARKSEPAGNQLAILGFTLSALLPLLALAIVGTILAGDSRHARFARGWGVASVIGFLAVPGFYMHYALPLCAPLAVMAAPIFARQLVGPMAAAALVCIAAIQGGSLDLSRRAASQERTNLAMMRTNTYKDKNGKRRTETRQVITKITVENALKGMLVHSANDAAVVLAEAIGGSVEGFADKMNATAERLGMNDSHFMNPNGLPHTRQFTTVSDMAKLSVAVIKDFPEYYHFFGNRTFTYNGTSYRNYNNLLGSYDGVDGLKTGFIRVSGFNLTASGGFGGNWAWWTMPVGPPSAPNPTLFHVKQSASNRPGSTRATCLRRNRHGCWARPLSTSTTCSICCVAPM